jgi:hypothetical protein
MVLIRLSLDIENGWPVAKPDDKGPLTFYKECEELQQRYNSLVERTKITDAVLHRFYTTFDDAGLRDAQGGMVVKLAENKIRLGQLQMPSDFHKDRDF